LQRRGPRPFAPRFQRALAAAFHDPEDLGTAGSTKSFAIIENHSEIARSLGLGQETGCCSALWQERGEG